MISKDLTNWLAKYGARFEDIQEDDSGRKFIVAEYDYGAGRISLPYEYQPKEIQIKMAEERLLSRLSLEAIAKL